MVLIYSHLFLIVRPRYNEMRCLSPKIVDLNCGPVSILSCLYSRTLLNSLSGRSFLRKVEHLEETQQSDLLTTLINLWDEFQDTKIPLENSTCPIALTSEYIEWIVGNL